MEKQLLLLSMTYHTNRQKVILLHSDFKMPFSNEEKRDMLRVYYFCNRNNQRASDMYFQEYPERNQPHITFFKKLDFNVKEYGSVDKPRQKYGSRVTNAERELVVNQVSFPLHYIFL